MKNRYLFSGLLLFLTLLFFTWTRAWAGAPPSIVCPSNQTNYTNGYDTVSGVVANDIDGTIASLSVSYSGGIGVNNVSLVNVQGTGTGHATADVRYNVADHCQTGGTVSVIATDDEGDKDTCTFTITLSNHAPDITCPSNASFHYDDSYSGQATATDQDGDNYTFSKVSGPAGVNVTTNGGITWATGSGNVGEYNVKVKVEDGCLAFDTCTFHLSVTNTPPVIVCPSNQTNYTNGYDTISGVVANDTVGTISSLSVSYSGGSGINNVSLVNVQGAGTGHATADVRYNVANHCQAGGTTSVIAMDEVGAKDTCTFTITLSNHTPDITCPSNASFHYYNGYIGTATATDQDGDSRTFSKVSGPAGLTVATNGGITWNTTMSDVGGPYNVMVKVTDACGDSDRCTFQLTVLNDPPVITCPNPETKHTNGSFTTTTKFTSYDPDSSLKDVTATPPGAPITSASVNYDYKTKGSAKGTITYTVSNHCAIGTYYVQLVARDSLNTADTCNLPITLQNTAPMIACPLDTQGQYDRPILSGPFTIYDPDTDSMGVTISNVIPTPFGTFSIEANKVKFMAVPTDIGILYTVTLGVTEKAPCNLSSSCSFKMRATNASPFIFCPLPETQNENGSYTTTTTFLAYDPDSALKSVTGSSPPGGAVAFDSVHYIYKTKGSAKGSVFYKVTNHCNTGTYNIQLTATDSVNTTAFCYLPITLQSYAPYFVNCPHSGDSVQAGFKFVSSSFSTYDLDGDSVSVLFLGITPPAINTPYTVGNHVEWMTTQIDTGRFNIQLQAIDQCGAKDTCAFFVYSHLRLPDFTVTASPETCCVSAGNSISYQVALTSLFGFDNPCTLLVSGLTEPSDSGIFDDPILTPTDTTLLTIYTSTETDTGYYTLIVIAHEMSGGKSFSIIHTIQVVLKVNESSDVREITDNPNNPKTFALFQNQPNPFNPETKIRYSLPRPGQVRLTIYNLLGQKIRILVDGYQNAGIYSMIWDGKDNDGVPLSSGIYFYQLTAGNYQQTRKMVLMK